MSVAIFLATCSLGTSSSDSTGRAAGAFGGGFVLTWVALVMVVFDSVHAGGSFGRTVGVGFCGGAGSDFRRLLRSVHSRGILRIG
jgi:hypothetical protein